MSVLFWVHRHLLEIHVDSGVCLKGMDSGRVGDFSRIVLVMRIKKKARRSIPFCAVWFFTEAESDSLVGDESGEVG